MSTRFKVPIALREYYFHLKELLDADKFKEAENYLHNLPVPIYDMIIERSIQHDPFAAIIHRIERKQKTPFESELKYNGLLQDNHNQF